MIAEVPSKTEEQEVQKVKTGRRWILRSLAFLLIGVLLFCLCSGVVRPAHTSYGSTWSAYLAEPKNSIDVLFLGSSYAYCDWNPGIIYAASGLTSYVMAGSEQVPAITYYYLKEALRTQKPNVVVMEASNLFFDRYESYTKINLGYMPWGMNRVQAILECAEPENKFGLFCDLYFYHGRWKEVGASDIKKAISPPGFDHLKGYTAVDAVFEPSSGPSVSGMVQSEQVYQQNLGDFARIAALCEKEGIDLILTINPTYSQYTTEVYERLRADVEVNDRVRFVNWSNDFAQIGLDPSVHLYDGGHLNQAGARIFSAYTGEYLLELGYEPRPQTEENRAAWEETTKYWDADTESTKG